MVKLLPTAYGNCLKLTVFSLFALAIPNADAGEFSQETYLLKQPLYASTAIDRADDALGDLFVCAVITTGKSGREIEVDVTMPDSGQTISINAPLKQLRDGRLIFTFNDDGWGNFGKGSLKISGNEARLELVNTGSKPDAVPNVRRNYGKFSLSRGTCAVPH